jgi:hypothetical protein
MSTNLSYPMLYDRLLPLAALLSIEDDNATVIASNCSTGLQRLECANAIAIAMTHAILDTGAVARIQCPNASLMQLKLLR